MPAAAVTPGTLARIAARSFSDRAKAVPSPERLPPEVNEPGMTTSTLVPSALIRASIACPAPVATDTITITEATPMITPSMARKLRSAFTFSAAMATLQEASGFMLASSTISPSRKVIRRRARLAMSGSWVTRITVMPVAFSSSNRAMISSVVWLSSAPVGSSARMMCGSLTSARAIATRCCWPPESSEGWWSSRWARPTLARQALALSRACLWPRGE